MLDLKLSKEPMYMIYSKYCEDRQKEGLFPDVSVSGWLEEVSSTLFFKTPFLFLFFLALELKIPTDGNSTFFFQ